VTRCRTTDPPTERPTMNPARASVPGSVAMTCTTSVGDAALVPPRRTARKSCARRILRRTGSNGCLVMTRPRGACDPCRGVRPELHVRRGCSSGSGTRACGRADDCSAGKCASWPHPCGWVISGEEPSPMGTTGRTDLFLSTKVRNALSTGQTRGQHDVSDRTGRTPRTCRGLPGSRTRRACGLGHRQPVENSCTLATDRARFATVAGSPDRPWEQTAWEVGRTGG
jgi:hypothetical protein